MIFVGPPGAGKTSFCAQSGGIFVVHQDDAGVLELFQRGLVPPSTLIISEFYNSPQRLIDLMTIAADQCDALGRRTVIVESFTTIYAVWAKHCIETHFKGNTFEFHSFGTGVKKLLSHQTYCPDLLETIHKIRKRGLNVIFTSHSVEKSKTDQKTGITVDASKVQFPDSVFNSLAATSQLVGVFGTKVEVDKVKGGKTKIDEGSEGVSRFMSVGKTAYTDAKNWFGLREPIEMNDTVENNWIAFCRQCKIDRFTLNFNG